MKIKQKRKVTRVKLTTIKTHASFVNGKYKKVSVYDKRGKYRNNKTCLVEEMRYRLKKKI